jgi:hypothetical protein
MFLIFLIVLLLAGCSTNEPTPTLQHASPIHRDKVVELLNEKYDTSVTFSDDFNNAVNFAEIYWQKYSWSNFEKTLISPKRLLDLRERTLSDLKSLERNNISCDVIKALLSIRLVSISGTLASSVVVDDWDAAIGIHEYLIAASQVLKTKSFHDDCNNHLYDPLLYKGILAFCTDAKIFQNCPFVLIQVWMSIVFSANSRVIIYINIDYGPGMHLSWKTVSAYVDFLDLVVSCNDPARRSAMIEPFKQSTEILIRLIQNPEQYLSTKGILGKHIGHVTEELKHVMLPTKC